MVQARNVSKTYGSNGHLNKALDNITMTILEGEFVGLMGPSGAGKTSLLNIFSTIDTASSGEIKIMGKDINAMKEAELANFRRHELGFVFQDYHLLDTLSVKDNIVLPLALSGVPVHEIEKRAQEIAHKLDLVDVLSQFPYQISGGQKQRAAVARAMIAKPRLVLADEPTGALDSKAATDVLERLQTLNQTDRATILLVTHDAYAASFCQRIIFMKDGRFDQELDRRGRSRVEFFHVILDMLATLGGNA
nr:ABC transporter ATP-binding protein [Fictibacillus macauensis]